MDEQDFTVLLLSKERSKLTFHSNGQIIRFSEKVKKKVFLKKSYIIICCIFLIYHNQLQLFRKGNSV